MNMQITPEQIKAIVEKNKFKNFSIRSRIGMEDLIHFTYEVLEEIGEIKTANKILLLERRIDRIETNDLMKLEVWDL